MIYAYLSLRTWGTERGTWKVKKITNWFDVYHFFAASPFTNDKWHFPTKVHSLHLCSGTHWLSFSLLLLSAVTSISLYLWDHFHQHSNMSYISLLKIQSLLMQHPFPITTTFSLLPFTAKILQLSMVSLSTSSSFIPYASYLDWIYNPTASSWLFLSKSSDQTPHCQILWSFYCLYLFMLSEAFNTVDYSSYWDISYVNFNDTIFIRFYFYLLTSNGYKINHKILSSNPKKVKEGKRD